MSRRDPELFREIDVHFQSYADLLSGLGYSLIRHPRDFFYLVGGSGATSDRLRAVTVFVMVLLQYLEDTKFSSGSGDTSARSGIGQWENEVVGRIFDIDRLPHFATEPRRQLMLRLGVDESNLRQKVLKPMENWGMLQHVSPGKFVLSPPVHRFLDLCERYAEDGLPGAAGGSTPSPEPVTDGARGTGNDEASHDLGDEESPL